MSELFDCLNFNQTAASSSQSSASQPPSTSKVYWHTSPSPGLLQQYRNDQDSPTIPLGTQAFIGELIKARTATISRSKAECQREAALSPTASRRKSKRKSTDQRPESTINLVSSDSHLQQASRNGDGDDDHEDDKENDSSHKQQQQCIAPIVFQLGEMDESSPESRTRRIMDASHTGRLRQPSASLTTAHEPSPTNLSLTSSISSGSSCFSNQSGKSSSNVLPHLKASRRLASITHSNGGHTYRSPSARRLSRKSRQGRLSKRAAVSTASASSSGLGLGRDSLAGLGIGVGTSAIPTHPNHCRKLLEDLNAVLEQGLEAVAAVRTESAETTTLTGTVQGDLVQITSTSVSQKSGSISLRPPHSRSSQHNAMELDHHLVKLSPRTPISRSVSAPEHSLFPSANHSHGPSPSRPEPQHYATKRTLTTFKSDYDVFRTSFRNQTGDLDHDLVIHEFRPNPPSPPPPPPQQSSSFKPVQIAQQQPFQQQPVSHDDETLQDLRHPAVLAPHSFSHFANHPKKKGTVTRAAAAITTTTTTTTTIPLATSSTTTGIHSSTSSTFVPTSVTTAAAVLTERGNEHRNSVAKRLLSTRTDSRKNLGTRPNSIAVSNSHSHTGVSTSLVVPSSCHVTSDIIDLTLPDDDDSLNEVVSIIPPPLVPDHDQSTRSPCKPPPLVPSRTSRRILSQVRQPGLLRSSQSYSSGIRRSSPSAPFRPPARNNFSKPTTTIHHHIGSDDSLGLNDEDDADFVSLANQLGY